MYSDLDLNEENKNIINNFSNNLKNLDKHISKKKFKAIFITQVKFDGISDINLYLVNEYLKKFCTEKNYPIIKLDELTKDFSEGDFYDEYHTTIKGSTKISNLIYSQLKEILIKNFTN